MNLVKVLWCVAVLAVVGCQPVSRMTAPTHLAIASNMALEGDGVSCPTDPPFNLTVGQTQGRTDISWESVPGQSVFRVWITEEEGNNYVWIEGAPATADGHRYETYLSERIHTVQVQALVCGNIEGAMSEEVVFGGWGGELIPPQPPLCRPDFFC